MEIKQYQAAMEAVLFSAGEPVPLSRLAEALELDEESAGKLAEDLRQEINTRTGGIRMVKMEDRYQLCTKTEYASYVRRALDIRRNTPLSQAAMEVLAIIAYNQPVTRSFIEQVRGIDSSSTVVNLVEKGLVAEQAAGLARPPMAYKTTDNFLRCFGLALPGGPAPGGAVCRTGPPRSRRKGRRKRRSRPRADARSPQGGQTSPGRSAVAGCCGRHSQRRGEEGTCHGVGVDRADPPWAFSCCWRFCCSSP